MTEAPARVDISFVVCTRNRAEMLETCLQSLLDQDLDPTRLEVVAVDDGSTDSTPQVLRAFARKGLQLKVVRQDQGGVNAARNAGIGRSSAAIIAFLDDDEIAPPSHAKRLLATFADHPDADGVGGALVDTGDRPLRTCADCSLGSSDLPGSGTREVGRLIGGNMALRASAFERFGLFDPAISGRGDETEWFHRARGAQLIHSDELAVLHRRDTFGLLDLARHALRQGMALPVAWRHMGREYPLRPQRIPLGIGHALRHRCAKGLVTACRELGVTLTWLGSRFGRGRDGVSWTSSGRRRTP